MNRSYGNDADSIIRCARENNLYVHQAPGLVALLAQVEADMPIPPQLYGAVAELLAWIHQLESDSSESAPS
jgi:flagellar biosynthesis protein